jgi:TonB family protein
MILNRLLLALLISLTSTIISAQETKPPLLPPRGITLLLETEMSCRDYIKNPTKPKYPENAREAGIEGEVLIFVWFDQNGKLVEAKTLRSPHESLSEAALNTVRQWRFEPHAPLFPDANFMGEVRFLFSLANGKSEVLEASKEEQARQSDEFNDELKRRRSRATP